MIRVLLVDDQALVRGGFAMLLAAETDVDVVGECGDGVEAVEAAQRLRPDIVIMDVRMPGMDGVEATRRLLSSDEQEDGLLKVIILTTYNVDRDVYRALRAGASGFLLKDAAPADLVAAVRSVSAGEGWLDPAVTRALIREFATRPYPEEPTLEEMSELTPREREILVLVAHGLSNGDIASRLTISVATVKTHFGRVLMKLGLRDRAQAVAAAYRSGLIPPTSPRRR